MVLGFFDLPEDDIPPQNLWHSETHLREWFDTVEQRHKDRAQGFQPIDDEPDMMENELARGLRG